MNTNSDDFLSIHKKSIDNRSPQSSYTISDTENIQSMNSDNLSQKMELSDDYIPLECSIQEEYHPKISHIISINKDENIITKKFNNILPTIPDIRGKIHHEDRISKKWNQKVILQQNNTIIDLEEKLHNPNYLNIECICNRIAKEKLESKICIAKKHKCVCLIFIYNNFAPIIACKSNCHFCICKKGPIQNLGFDLCRWKSNHIMKFRNTCIC